MIARMMRSDEQSGAAERRCRTANDTARTPLPRRRVRNVVCLLVTVLAWLTAPTVRAHELRLGYLMIHQTGRGTYDILWKVPVGDVSLRADVQVIFPEGTARLTEPAGFRDGGDYVARWRVRRPEGFDGQDIIIDGLSAMQMAVLVRVEREGGMTQTTRVVPGTPRFRVEAIPTGWEASGTYLRLGLEHILLGIDHLLFVLTLILVVKDWKRLIGTITAFTISHSLTLAAATLGIVHVPGAPVEACIALSIVFVAAEIVRERGGHPGVTESESRVVAFTFGLLHGLGFAGALSDVGLPPHAIPLALLSFNVGVELGQLAFIGAVVPVVAGVQRLPLRLPGGGMRVAPYIVGAVAMFWVIERAAAFRSGG